jgi:16S rRNA (cytosine1402-N4)-methyltransferase
MPGEVLAYLHPRAGGRYLDGTLGGGGHARLVLEASAPDGLLIGCDRDTRAIDRCHFSLAPFADRIRLQHADFRAVPSLLPGEHFDGILLDLGVSSWQLDDPCAGFSFRADGPLDMRMDPTSGRTAADLVNGLAEEELARIIAEYGEERYARRVARVIVAAREKELIGTTGRLAEIVRSAVPRGREPGAIDPATRTFQGLRIAVNEELDGLEAALCALADMLDPGGRLVVIAFHSLEDRIVKWAFRRLCGDIPDEGPRGLPVMTSRPPARFAALTRKPVSPGPEEQRANPRARSARLRAIERIAEAA